MAKAKLTYLGRMIALQPRELGAQFEDVCQVTTHHTEAASLENGWKQKEVHQDHTLWWTAPNPDGTESWCAMSGYGPRIEFVLREQGHEVEVVDLMPSGLPAPRFDNLGAVEWRGSQKAILAACLANRIGLVVCPTGFGKSFLVQCLCKLYPGCRIIATVPSTDVARDLHARISSNIDNVGFVGDGSNNPQLITVAVTHSLHRCNSDAALVICDEAHAVLTEDLMAKFAMFGRAKFLAFTASPEGRGDGGDGFMEALFGPALCRVPYSEAVESGNVAPIKVWMYNQTIGPDVSKHKRRDIKNRYGIWTNGARHQTIARAVYEARQVLGADAQILIMVQTIEHAMRLQQILTDFVVVTGEAEDLREVELRACGGMLEWQKICTKKERAAYKDAFSSGQLRCAIANMIWSKGVDFKGLQCLIRGDGLASPIQSTQVPGRLSRLGHDGQKEYGLLIDINDIFSSDLRWRSKTRADSYTQHGWSIEYRQ